MRTQGLLLIFLCILRATAQTTLAGDVDGMTFGPSGNPYIVTGNITVSENKTTAIKAGCVFLFKPFTGITVNGSMTVSGTLDNPVIFTSENDTAYNHNAELLANPFDWNGILVSQQAQTVSFSNFVISYSVYGLKSQKKAFTINNGVFKGNGQFNVTINDAILPVVDGMPYSFSGVPEKMKERTPSPVLLKGIAAAAALCAAGSGIGAAASFKSYADYEAKFESETSLKRLAELKEMKQQKLVSGVVFSGVAALMVPVSLVLFLKDTTKKDIPVSVVPSLHTDGAAVAVNIRF